ncbi:hypothetical protein ACJZ2D_007956 [Fusarium nematophilum]
MAGSRQDPVDLGSDMDEDEALRYAIALSLQEQEEQESSRDQQGSQIPDASASTSRRNGTGSAGGASGGLLSLDRKKMEEERLQRLAKRRRSPSSDDIVSVVEVPPPKRRAPVEPSGSSATASAAAPPRLPPFPNGAVKRTWARGYPRTSEDIKIEEVLQKDRLQLAVLSSYQWDDEWLMSKLDLRRTKLLLVAYAADEAQRTAMRSNTPSGIRFCFPAMNGPGAMHSKLQLLKYQDYLRVVVPTANLVPYDWGETGVMENMVFLIDLPRLGDSAQHQPTAFSTELGRFLTATGVEASMVSSLSNYDFSRTTHLGFVYTMATPHGEQEHDALMQRILAQAAIWEIPSSESAQCTMLVEVWRHQYCAPLSPGAPHMALDRDDCGLTVTDGLTRDIGDDGMAEYKSRIGRPSAAAKDKTANPWRSKLKDRFRIYFPTDESVGRSRGGRMAAGTICVQPKWWRSSTFPTELVRDCVSSRDGLLMHSKMIFVRRTAATQGESQTRQRSRLRPEPRRREWEPTATCGSNDVDDSADPSAAETSPGWAYIGSANLSESAWGRIVKDRATGQPKMSCRNWESGVVVRISSSSTSTSRSSAVTVSSSGSTNVKAAEAQARAQAQAGNPSGQPGKGDKGGDTSQTQELVTDMGIFDGTVPVPMRLPGRRYRAGEEPWFYTAVVQG